MVAATFLLGDGDAADALDGADVVVGLVEGATLLIIVAAVAEPEAGADPEAEEEPL